MPEGLERLSIIVFDGSYERIHYALVLASAAAATNRPATLFFTGPALQALTAEGWRGLAGDPEGADRRLAERKVATLDALLDACRDLGVRFIACEAGLRAADLPRAALRDDLAIEVAGVVTLLGQAARTGGLLFI